MSPRLLILVLQLLLLPSILAQERKKGKEKNKEPSQDVKMECDNATIGGAPADITAVPWLAAITVRDRDKCVGAIYSMNYILTAAKCVNGYKVEAIKVRVGTTSRNANGTVVSVCDVIIHTDFHPKHIENNLALLKLCNPLQTSDKIKEIPVAKHVPADQAVVTASGWASVRWMKLLGEACLPELALELHKSEVRVYNTNKCTEVWKRWYKVDNNRFKDLVMCTGKAGKGACSFDMGAPLVFSNQLVGILSRCSCSERPDIYSRLPTHIKWLEENSKK